MGQEVERKVSGGGGEGGVRRASEDADEERSQATDTRVHVSEAGDTSETASGTERNGYSYELLVCTVQYATTARARERSRATRNS